MKWLLALFFILCSVVVAMEGPVKRFKKPRHKKALKLQQTENQMQIELQEMPHLPREVFIEIFMFVFDFVSLKKVFIDPMSPYKQVSRTWYEYCKSKPFMSQMKKHPRMALLKLKQSLDIELEGNAELLHVCKDLINVETSRELIMKARSPSAFEQLWIIPVFRSTNLSARAYKRLLNDAVSKGIIRRPLIPTLPIDAAEDDPQRVAFETDPRGLIESHLELFIAEPDLIVEQLCLTQLIKLAYFDDMFRPEELTCTFQLINYQVSMAYHSKRQYLVKRIVDGLRMVFLPHRAENMLYVCMEYSLFLAAYIGDRQFLEFVGLEYESIKLFSGKLVEDDESFLDALKSVQIGELNVYPVEMLPAVLELLECHIYDKLLGFDGEKIVARSQEILDDPRVDDATKLMITEHLYHHIQDID